MKSNRYHILFLVLINILKVFGEKDWWEHAVIYQIYPITFKDSNGDGMGDLQGIISKLDHLKDINVDGIWISPIYQSPYVDGGYDISDFKEIDPKFGTMEDFEELVTKAEEKGMKIIMDLVPNHSSSDHAWFQESLKKNGKYSNYYIWRDGEANAITNWISVFDGPAWTLESTRKEYYLHQFHEKQPDLNYDNPDVVEEMDNIIKFWLDKGVAGFRVDAIKHLFEEFKDEPVANPSADPLTYGYHNHIYTTDQDKTYDMVYYWRKLVDDYKSDYTRILMTESYSSMEEIMRYYTNGAVPGAHFPFNFNLVDGLNTNSNAVDIASLITTWFVHMPPGFVPNWVLGNHDKHRVATRLGSQEKANMMNMLTAVLPGVMVTYNGEEIGMENGEVTFAQGKDQSVTEETFEEKSRDFERTPFHWNDEYAAGFTSEGTTNLWLPVSEKYKTNNLEAQKTQKASIYQNYKALTGLRKSSKALSEGKSSVSWLNNDVIIVIREHENESVIFICHLGVTKDNFTLNLKENEWFQSTHMPKTEEYKIIATNVVDKFGTDGKLENNEIKVAPNEAYVFYFNSANINSLSLILIFGLLISYLNDFLF